MAKNNGNVKDFLAKLQQDRKDGDGKFWKQAEKYPWDKVEDLVKGSLDLFLETFQIGTIVPKESHQRLMALLAIAAQNHTNGYIRHSAAFVRNTMTAVVTREKLSDGKVKIRGGGYATQLTGTGEQFMLSKWGQSQVQRFREKLDGEIPEAKEPAKGKDGEIPF